MARRHGALRARLAPASAPGRRFWQVPEASRGADIESICIVKRCHDIMYDEYERYDNTYMYIYIYSYIDYSIVMYTHLSFQTLRLQM